MLVTLLLQFWLQIAITTVHAQTPACVDTQGTLCVSFSPSSAGSFVATVQSTSRGWAGVGFGVRDMDTPAPVYVGWLNANQQPVVSVRTLGGPRMPVFSSAAKQIAVPSEVAPITGAVLTYSFLVPSSVFSGGKSVSAIYAVSNKLPSNRDAVDSDFEQHTKFGQFSIPASVIDTSQPTTTPMSGDKFQNSLTQSTFCLDNESSFCVVANLIENAVVFTAFSTHRGWIAFGIGLTMSESTMFVGWRSGSDIIISERTTTGHNAPQVASNTTFKQVSTPSFVTVPSGVAISFSISLPVSANVVSRTEPSNFIFAFSDSPPSDPSSASSSFSQHSYYSSFTLDLSKTGTQTNGIQVASSHSSLILAHGILMFIAWGICAPTAIFIARYLKTVLGYYWFLSHIGLFIAVGLFMIAGLIAVELTIDSSEQRFIANGIHGIIGTVIALVIYPLQVFLGYVSNKLFNAKRTSIPVIDQIHWWVGRVVAILAVVNMYLGLVQFESSLVVEAVYWTWISLVVFGLFMGGGEYWLGGSVHHLEVPKPSERSSPLPLGPEQQHESLDVVSHGFLASSESQETLVHKELPEIPALRK
ncbi:UNVERIFIED_CONTAM: hypothetical protein HDU68_008194 [Siphonaria sp. JEL0065]|nr:hypothetical protein HDU68_008194 [Siphonaria sp. JEL0065]